MTEIQDAVWTELVVLANNPPQDREQFNEALNNASKLLSSLIDLRETSKNFIPRCQ